MRRASRGEAAPAPFARAAREARVASVCDEARCEHRATCAGERTAAFLLLGNACSRSCGFCAFRGGSPPPPDPDEPRRVATLAAKLGLSHVVLTAVDRDDLPDGGATHFAAAVRAVRALAPAAKVEALVPDFGGERRSLARVLEERPDCLAHALETVPRLYPALRPGSDYARSVDLLRRARDWHGTVAVKSGLVLGLGERRDEIVATLADLASVGCGILSIGAYAPNGADAPRAARAVPPEEFEEWRRTAERLGIGRVVAGPSVKTTYGAAALLGGPD